MKSRFIDKTEFEKVEREGNRAIQNWIDSQLNGTSVTASRYTYLTGESRSRVRTALGCLKNRHPLF